MHHYEATLRRLVLSEAMTSRRRHGRIGLRTTPVRPYKCVWPGFKAHTDYAAWLYDHKATVPEIAARIGVSERHVRVLLRASGRCRDVETRAFDAAFYSARQEHVFMLWCEGLSTNDIAARVAGVGKGRVQLIMRKFLYRLSRAMHNTRLTVETQIQEA